MEPARDVDSQEEGNADECVQQQLKDFFEESDQVLEIVKINIRESIFASLREKSIESSGGPRADKEENINNDNNNSSNNNQLNSKLDSIYDRLTKIVSVSREGGNRKIKNRKNKK